MLHLVHLPSGRVIDVGDPLENGFVRITSSTALMNDLFPCVRLRDKHGFILTLVEGVRFRDYLVIGD